MVPLQHSPRLHTLADSFSDMLALSGLSGLSKGCCSLLASLKSALDMRLKWHHCLVNISSGKTVPSWSLWEHGELGMCWEGSHPGGLDGQPVCQVTGCVCGDGFDLMHSPHNSSSHCPLPWPLCQAALWVLFHGNSSADAGVCV